MFFNVKTVKFPFYFVLSLLLFTCCSPKNNMQKVIAKMKSEKINISYDQMQCWTSDSLKMLSPWRSSKMRLVHYIDSVRCSSCYLQTIARREELLKLVEKFDEEIYNVFIISPDKKTKRKLASEFAGKLIPETIFVDSANVFRRQNPNIPQEEIYHTFLLDENNNIVLVGNPYYNSKIMDMLSSIMEKRLGKKCENKS